MDVKRRLFPMTFIALALLLTACGSSAETKPLTGVYLALGDSLSEGIGASDAEETSFVALVHDGLGPNIELMNLGAAGNTSRDLIDEQLDRATDEIATRNSDANPENDVAVITLEIGGNDLLEIFFDLVLPGICPNLEDGLNNPECVQKVRETLDTYGPNLDEVLTRLREADPDVPIFLLTLYNPFSGGTAALDELVELALEGRPDTPFPEGLHDIVREQAATHDTHLVEVSPHFHGKARQYIARDLIHPNDTGYRVMADAVLKEMRDTGLID
jgi:lysophospholipase L1-like esterase